MDFLHLRTKELTILVWGGGQRVKSRGPEWRHWYTASLPISAKSREVVLGEGWGLLGTWKAEVLTGARQGWELHTGTLQRWWGTGVVRHRGWIPAQTWIWVVWSLYGTRNPRLTLELAGF